MAKFRYIDNAEVKAHLAYLRQYMSFREVGRRCSISGSTLAGHLQQHRGQCRIAADMAEAILAVQPTPQDLITQEERGRGARRILFGMLVKGWTCEALAEGLSMSWMSMQRFLAPSTRNYDAVSAPLYREILAMADKLESADPLDHGVTTNRSKQNATRFRSHPPIGCWDLDTVHLADAYPEYTGCCGTERGYQIHYREGHKFHRPYGQDAIRRGKAKPGETYFVRACGPCASAHQQWKRDLRDGVPGMKEQRDAMIRELHADGATLQELATEFELSVKTIERAVKP